MRMKQSFREYGTIKKLLEIFLIIIGLDKLELINQSTVSKIVDNLTSYLH